ncbi:MAG TPA: UDP-N-acetylmuramate dehydrogenase [Gemmataceae bacterium]
MTFPGEFAAITKTQEPLAPLTHLRIGGPAEYLVHPRDREELAAVVRHCRAAGLPLRVLGGGCNLLVRDEGVSGVVLRLSAPAFTQIRVEGRRVTAGAGAALAALISQAARHDLAGVEALVGIVGTVGGALRCNAGDRAAEISQFVRRVEVMDEHGQVQQRERAEIHFHEHASDLDDPVILAAEFELEPDSAGAIVKRMIKAWIHRKASQPYSYQAAVRAFKNPRGQSAADLIEKAGLSKTRVGGAEVSERNANYIVAHPGATARDVLRLIELIQSRVGEAAGVQMERELLVW